MKTAQYLTSSRPTTALLPKVPARPPLPLPIPLAHRVTSRQFISTPLNPETQSLKAARTLSYSASKIFSLISDIDSYSTFLPYCSSSTVTSWSSAAKPTKKKYPQEAELQVGWAGYSETFRSKVFCVPDTVVEAVCGSARTTIPHDDLDHYSADALEPQSDDTATEGSGGNAVFSSLLTTWTLREFPYKPAPEGQPGPHQGSPSAPPIPQTEVDLNIQVQFASPVYAALSKAAAPKVAGVLMEAFVKRAREVLGEEAGRPGQSAEKAEKVEGESTLEGAIGGDGLKESP